MLEISTTDFECNKDDLMKKAVGSSCHGYYDLYHNFSVWNKIMVNNMIFDAVYQTANGFLHNDYLCPDPNLSFSRDAGSHDMLILIDGLRENDFEKDLELINDVLSEVKEFCPVIDTVEKLKQIYDALNDNRPHISDFIDDDDLKMEYNEF